MVDDAVLLQSGRWLFEIASRKLVRYAPGWRLIEG